MMLLDKLSFSAESFQIDTLLNAVNQITALLYEYQYGDYEALEMRHLQQLDFDNPLEMLIQKRISLAKKLLAETNQPVQDIMAHVGYKDYSYFIKLFKKQVNCIPYAYRKKAIQNAAAQEETFK